jgi:hypothetical protein
MPKKPDINVSRKVVWGSLAGVALVGILAGSLVTAYTGTGGAGDNKKAVAFDLAAAYTAAAPGSTITVPAGSYGDVTLAGTKPAATCRRAADWQDGTSTPQDLSGCIHIVPDSPGSVTINDLNIQGPLVWLDGINLSSAKGLGALTVRAANGACPSPNPIHDIIVQNMTAVSFLTKGMSYVSFVSDTFNHINEGTSDYSNTIGFCPSPIPYQSNHVLFDKDLIENVQWTTSGEHIEGVHIWSANDMTIQNTKFLNNAQFDISWQGDSDQIVHVLMQNDVFDETCSHQYYGGTGGCNATAPGGNATNGGHIVVIGQTAGFTEDYFLIRYNAMPADDFVQLIPSGNPVVSIVEYGNIIGTMPSFPCSGQLSEGVVIHDNVFQNGSSCGTAATSVAGSTSVYVNAGGYDYSEKATSPSVGVVPAAVARPLTDLTGAARGTAATDAGAYVLNGNPNPPPPPTPPPPYNPACATTCDQQIATLTATVASLTAQLASSQAQTAAVQAQLDAAKAQLATALLDAKKVVTDLGG